MGEGRHVGVSLNTKNQLSYFKIDPRKHTYVRGSKAGSRREAPATNVAMTSWKVVKLEVEQAERVACSAFGLR